MANISRLQFRHKTEVFENRDKALSYFDMIVDQTRGELYRLDETLLGEPIIVRYKDENDKIQLILAIGTEGEKGEGVLEPFHLIDSANIEAGIETLSGATEELRQELAAEIARALAAEEVLDQKINAVAEDLSAETAERIAADEALNTKIDVETNRAEEAEADLEDQINNLLVQKYDGTLEANVKEAYILVDRNGDTHGEMIPVYKDASLTDAYLGHMGDYVDPITGEVTKTDLGSEALCLLYYLADGHYKLVNINLETFIQENEFKDGLEVNPEHEVRVKIDDNSEVFLTVSMDGVKLSGVQDAIDAASGSLQDELDATQAGAGLSGDGSYIHYHEGKYIGSASSLYDADKRLDTALYEESERAKSKETELSGIIEAETTRATNKETELENAVNAEELRAEAAETSLASGIEAEVVRAIAAEDGIQDELDATQAGAGLSGDGSYIHYHAGHYIDEASSLYEADQKLDTALYEVSSASTGAVEEEKQRAMTAEAILDEKISDEETRAKSVESGLETAIAAEVTRATTKEAEIENSVSTLSGNVESAIESLSGNVETAIDALDYSDTADTKKVVTAVNETDGIVSVIRDFIGSDMVKINPITPSSANVREEWELVNGNGSRLGSTIKIYKDSSLENVYIGHVDDTLPDPTSPSHTTGTGDTALCFIYLKSDGTYVLVAVNVEEFIHESEFKDGLQVINHEVSVKIDSESENFLTVSPNGVKLSGVQNAISTAITLVSGAVETLETQVSTISSNLNTVTTNLANEVARATSAESTINERINTVTGNVNTLSASLTIEISNRINGDELLNQAIQNEITNRATAVSNEASARTQADNTLTTLINSEKELRASAIAEEAELRSAADTTLSGAVNTEKSAREAADTALQTSIANEATARDAADDELDERITGLAIQEVTTGLDSNVLKAYELKNKDGQTQGVRINIYKDSALYLAYLGHVDDHIPADGSSPVVTPGTGDTALCLIYINSDGKYQLVAVDVQQFLEETEFSDGLVTDNHVVKVKIDNSGESYLTVGQNGVKLDGVDDAIEVAAKAATTEVVEGTDQGNNISIDKTYGADGNPLYTINLTDIASKTDFDAVSAKTSMMLGNGDELLQTSVIHAINDAVGDLVVPGGVVYELTNRIHRIEQALSALTDTVQTISDRIDAIVAGIHGADNQIVVNNSDETSIEIGFADDSEFDTNP